jgi:hypothetical protein
MTDDVLRVRVECYAGYRADEAPRAFWIEERRVGVTDVLDRWLAPDHRYFKVRGDDGDVYILRQDGAADQWYLTLYRRE